jgi:methylated-DNA-[protein]-cysteine S-methyltransferase
VICHLATIESPCGPLLCAVGEDGAIVRIEFPGGHSALRRQADRQVIRLVAESGAAGARRAEPLRRQLGEYFAGRRRAFDLELAPRGTPFQLAVWQALRAIPYGETRSYGEVALAVGRPDAVRAVGAANGANPLPIVVPCHRVIGADGSLTGFGGGIEVKAYLLELEGGGRSRPAQLALALGAAG